MNENKYDLKKMGQIALLVYILCMAVFTVGAYNVIFQSINKALYVGIVILGAIIIGFYFAYLQWCDKHNKKSLGIYFIRTYCKYQFLIEQLVTRDFKIKYKRSILGVFWSFLNPLLMMLVQYFVFVTIMKFEIPHYAIYLLCGIVIFNGFNDCTTQSMRSITGNATLITKVYVPKYIYPISKVCSASINILLSMAPLLLVTFVYGLFNDLYLKPSILLLPFALITLIIFIMGMGFLLSSLMVFFHDIEFLWGVVASMWMYATPIIYDINTIAVGKLSWVASIIKLNPMYHYVEFVRSIIISGTSPALSEYVICLAYSFGMFAIGAFVFKKTQDKFVLYI